MLNFDYPKRVSWQPRPSLAPSKPYAEKVLLHYGGEQKSGLYDRVAASLRESGVSFVSWEAFSRIPDCP